MPMLEAIEQRAAAQGVPVDARIERGRSYRHALERLLERGDLRPRRRPGDARPAPPASRATTSSGCCEKAPAEVLILRPGARGPARRLTVAARGRASPAPEC